MQEVEEIIEISGDEFSQGFCSGKEFCRLLQQALMEKDKIAAENEKLRGIFAFAQKEFEKRDKKVEYLEQELKRTLEENRSLKERLGKAEAKVQLFSSMLFGKSSEKRTAEPEEDNTTDDQFSIQEEAHSDKKKRGAMKGQRGHGRKIPADLPVREKIIDLDEDKKRCEKCGKPLVESGLEEVSSEISVEKSYYVIKITRKIYRKTCSCDKALIRAPLPPKLIPWGKFSTEFWVECLINKYLNALPVHRQIVEMETYGLDVSPGTIFGGFQKIYFDYLKVLYQAMERELRKADHWHADESRWQMFIEVEGKLNHNWFMWNFISHNIDLFVLDKTRSSSVPSRVLFDIENIKDAPVLEETTKMLNVDRFSAYKALQNKGMVQLSYCWAHVRRDFIGLETKYPEDLSLYRWAEEWIKRIAELYKINNERVKYNQGNALFKQYDKKLREKIDEIYSLINMEYPHSAQAAVMSSMREHWKGLTLFVKHSELPMDNNISERMLRLMVLGRKNYWGNHSLWGGFLSAAMFSIVQTCQMHELSPRAYLKYYLDECAKRGSAPPEDEIEAFLPHKLSEEIKSKLKKHNH